MSYSLLTDLDPLLKDGRTVDFCFVNGHYVVTAVPLQFEGGPVPDDWRAEGSTAAEALGELLGTWDKTPSDFQWPEMSSR